MMVSNNRFRYNGKEEQQIGGLDVLDYGARMYDPALRRFTTVDPLAEKFAFQSPYLYAYNNPVRFTDFMGMNAEDEVQKNEQSRDGSSNKEPEKVNVEDRYNR